MGSNSWKTLEQRATERWNAEAAEADAEADRRKLNEEHAHALLHELESVKRVSKRGMTANVGFVDGKSVLTVRDGERILCVTFNSSFYIVGPGANIGTNCAENEMLDRIEKFIEKA